MHFATWFARQSDEGQQCYLALLAIAAEPGNEEDVAQRLGRKEAQRGLPVHHRLEILKQDGFVLETRGRDDTGRTLFHPSAKGFAKLRTILPHA